MRPRTSSVTRRDAKLPESRGIHMRVILPGSATARFCHGQELIQPLPWDHRAVSASLKDRFTWPLPLCLCDSLCLEGLSTSCFLRLMALLRALNVT